MDAWLLELLNRRVASPWLDDLMVLLSTAGLVLLPGIGVWMLLRERHRRVALVLLGALLATLCATLLFQVVVARPRPADVRLTLAMPGFYSSFLSPHPPLRTSYPSGHASLAFCAAVLLSLVNRRRWFVAACLSGAALIALSRVYLGHHHPSDILGGAVLGSGVGALFFGLWLARGPRLRWGIWPQLSLVLVITQLAYLGILPRGWDLGLQHADKLLHFLLFGLLGFWLHLWLDGRRVPGGRLPLAALIVLGGAALEELAQSLSPSRSADIVDLGCDALGVLVFVWCADRILRGGAPRVLPSGPWSRETREHGDPPSAGPG